MLKIPCRELHQNLHHEFPLHFHSHRINSFMLVAHAQETWLIEKANSMMIQAAKSL
jgi:hypothetical protein